MSIFSSHAHRKELANLVTYQYSPILLPSQEIGFKGQKMSLHFKICPLNPTSGLDLWFPSNARIFILDWDQLSESLWLCFAIGVTQWMLHRPGFVAKCAPDPLWLQDCGMYSCLHYWPMASPEEPSPPFPSTLSPLMPTDYAFFKAESVQYLHAKHLRKVRC